MNMLLSAENISERMRFLNETYVLRYEHIVTSLKGLQGLGLFVTVLHCIASHERLTMTSDLFAVISQDQQ